MFFILADIARLILLFALVLAVQTLAIFVLQKVLEPLSRKIPWLQKIDRLNLLVITSGFLASLIGLLSLSISFYQISLPVSSFPTETSISLNSPSSIATTPIAAVTAIVVTATPIITSPTVQTPTPTVATGRLEATYPQKMKVEEADVFSVEIIINPQLTHVGEFPPNATGLISIEKRSTNGDRLRYESEIPLYPIMTAELQAQNFEFLDTKKDNRRLVIPGSPIGWVWNIQPKKAGEQTVTLNIFGEIKQDNGETFNSVVKSASLNIYVEDKSLLEKVSGTLTENIITILGTSGPLGILIAYLTYKSNKEKQVLQAKIGNLEKEKQELQQRLNALEKQVEIGNHTSRQSRRKSS